MPLDDEPGDNSYYDCTSTSTGDYCSHSSYHHADYCPWLFNEVARLLTAMTWPVWLQPYAEVVVVWVTWALHYVDLQYLEYLLWLFFPLLIAFLLPVFLIFFIYGCVIFLHIYKLRHQIREAYASSYWNGARTSIASFWDAVGYVWHGYELDGLEHIPDDGPALLVYYHGTLPIDVYYVVAKCILHKKRPLHLVGDKFIFKIPGWSMICKVFFVTPGTVDDCVNNLKAGNLMCISPGGVREALFSDSTYQILWGKRLGFARVILGAGCPVIPMFTENCREAFRTPSWAKRVFRWLYETTRAPLCPIYGGFPVKMKTHLAPAINFPPETTPLQVRRRVKREIRGLIREHQRLPGSIIRAILQRCVDKKRRRDADALLMSGGENGHSGANGNNNNNNHGDGDDRGRRRRRSPPWFARTGGGDYETDESMEEMQQMGDGDQQQQQQQQVTTRNRQSITLAPTFGDLQDATTTTTTTLLSTNNPNNHHQLQDNNYHHDSPSSTTTASNTAVDNRHSDLCPVTAASNNTTNPTVTAVTPGRTKPHTPLAEQESLTLSA